MDASSTLRDQGARALQDDDHDRAIDFLTRAVMASDRDAEAKSLLATAYSRKGLHAQAQRSAQGAVQLQPLNADFRCRLGQVLESAGESQAAAASYRDALQIQPAHAEAKARLELMGLRPAETAGAPQPTATPGGPIPRAPLAGTLQCGRCGEWSRPGPSCEWCAAMLQVPRTPPPPAYPQPPVPYAQPAYGQPPHAYGHGAPSYPPAYPPAYPSTQYPPTYGRPGAYGTMPYAPGPAYNYRKAHRGGSILALGVCSFAFCFLLGIAAWVMGNQDLAEMDAGIMDDSGRGLTQAGRVLGIIHTVGGLVIAAYCAVSILVAIGSGLR